MSGRKLMMEYRRYLVKSDILACFCGETPRGLQYIPAGALLETATCSKDLSMTEVLWAGRCLLVFQATLEDRAEILVTVGSDVSDSNNHDCLPIDRDSPSIPEGFVPDRAFISKAA
jgi:hypothetical protein